jgi:hypothetical protein
MVGMIVTLFTMRLKLEGEGSWEEPEKSQTFLFFLDGGHEDFDPGVVEVVV